MDLVLNFTFIALFFSLWVSLFTFCNINFFSLKSRRITFILTLISSLCFIFIGIYELFTKQIVENNFLVLAVNNINFYFGLMLNPLNGFFIFLFNVLFTCLLFKAFSEFKNEEYYYKCFIFLNLIQFSINSFFLSTNLIQMFSIYTLCPIFFYIIENMMNKYHHERAKNFLVLNKLGDFSILTSVSTMLYFAITYNNTPDIVFLEIKNLDNLFNSIFSMVDIKIFSFIILMFIFGIFIKTIFVFIHPLHNKTIRLFLTLCSCFVVMNVLFVFSPVLNMFEYTKSLVLISSLVAISLSLIILIVKRLFQNPVYYINKKSLTYTKKIYFFVANGCKFIDDYVINGVYDFILKIFEFFSGILSNFSTKKTYISFIFNLFGIAFLIFIVWVMYNFIIKG